MVVGPEYNWKCLQWLQVALSAKETAGAPQGACHQLSTHRAFLSCACGAAKNWQASGLDYLTLLVPELLAYASGMVAS